MSQSKWRFLGNGALVAAVEATLTSTSGDGLICDKVVVGKPNPLAIDIIRKEHNIPDSELSKCVFIGDNPMTDISIGNNAGIDTLLVLTGNTLNKEEAAKFCA